MSRTPSYTYDPKTKTWSKSTSINDSKSSKGNNSKIKKSGTSNLTASNSDSSTSTGSTEQQYNNIEINTLSGTLTFIVNDKTIKLKVGDTVNLQGLGKYLSGNYYVREVKRSINSSGYSHSAVCIRTDFGDSLKIVKT